MADGDLDPGYAARFQRGYEAPSEPDPEPDVEDVDEHAAAPSTESRPRRGAAVALLLVAVGFAALAAAAVGWIVNDPGFTVPPERDPLAATRLIARAAPGPIVVGVVVAVAAGLRVAELPRLASSLVAGVMAIGLIALVARTGAEAVRLAALTANGPVSSGGIPYPPLQMATFFERVRTVEVLDAILPWLVLAAALAVVLGVAVLLSRRPTA